MSRCIATSFLLREITSPLVSINWLNCRNTLNIFSLYSFLQGAVKENFIELSTPYFFLFSLKTWQGRSGYLFLRQKFFLTLNLSNQNLQNYYTTPDFTHSFGNYFSVLTKIPFNHTANFPVFITQFWHRFVNMIILRWELLMAL